MGGVKVVTDKINIYFDVSDYFYQSELGGRSYMLKEFVERVSQMVGTEYTQILITLYLNTTKNSARESELKEYCKKVNLVNPRIRYEVKKI